MGWGGVGGWALAATVKATSTPSKLQPPQVSAARLSSKGRAQVQLARRVHIGKRARSRHTPMKIMILTWMNMPYCLQVSHCGHTGTRGLGPFRAAENRVSQVQAQTGTHAGTCGVHTPCHDVRGPRLLALHICVSVRRSAHRSTGSGKGVRAGGPTGRRVRRREGSRAVFLPAKCSSERTPAQGGRRSAPPLHRHRHKSRTER